MLQSQLLTSIFIFLCAFAEMSLRPSDAAFVDVHIRVYDSWEKLVGAVLDREELRRLALCDSFSSSASSEQSNFSHHVVRPIELKEIIKATENFRQDLFLGEGSLCQAFKAWIDEHNLIASKPGSGMAVVVKVWRRNNPKRHQDWLKDISYLVNLRHPDLVDLVAYCMEEDNVILVYEFMPEGSLKNHLFTKRHSSLPWATRIKVALDAARGLSYLHGREIPVIHRDFRSASILLDGEFNAKLSNYGYGTEDPTGRVSTHTHLLYAARGYTAPEAKDELSTKSNVYSFGAVLLELLSGRAAPTLSWAKPYFSKKSKLVQVMDIRLDGQYSLDAAYSIAKLALKCLSLDPKFRPTMAHVVAALQHLQRT